MNKQTNKFTVSIVDQKYYVININDDLEFNLDDFAQLVTFQKELGNLKLPVLVICALNATTNLKVIKYISKNENNPFSKADAFVINSLAQKILANFYIKIDPPQRPTQFFKDKETAFKWLEQYF